jgi:hypothetical protein
MAFELPLPAPPLPGGDMALPQDLPPPVPPSDVPVPIMPAPAPAMPIPGTAPAAPAPAPTIEQAVADEAKANADKQALAEEDVANAKDLAHYDELADKNKAEELTRQAAEQQRTEQVRQQSLAHATAERDAIEQDVKNTKFHNLWEDLSTPRKALAVFGQLLGSISFDPHHVNEAANYIDRAIADDFAAQKEKLKNKYELLAAKNKNIGELQEQFRQESAQQQVRFAKQLEAVAAQGEYLASKSKNQVGINKAREIAANLRSAGADLEKKGVEGIADFHSKRLHDKLTQSEIELNKAKAQAEREGRGGDRDIKIELAVTKLVDGVVQKDKTVSKLQGEAEELAKTKEALRSGNPLLYGAALDSFTKSATGLGARPSSVKLFEDRIGGSLEQIKAAIQRAGSGNPFTPDMLKRFQSAVDDMEKTNAEERTKARSRFEDGLARNPALAKHKEVVASVLDTKFGAKPSPSAGPPQGSKRGKLANGAVAYKYPDGTIHTETGELVK